MIPLSPYSSLLCLSLTLALTAALNEPPTILTGPTAEPTYFTVKLELWCLATGSKDLTYTWLFNGTELSMNQYSYRFDQNSGLFSIATGAPEGRYQCRVQNKFGTAISNTTMARRIRLEADRDENLYPYSAQVGQTLTIPCKKDQAVIVPKAAYKWELVRSRTDTNVDNKITPDRRIQIDDEGNLYFAYVQQSDSQAGMMYRCHLVNVKNNDRELSLSYSTLTVSNNPVQPTSLTEMFQSVSPNPALVGGNATLRCFFGGSPSTTISWRRSDGKALGNRIDPGNTGTLTIIGVVLEDAGQYICTGASSGLQSIEKTLELKVEAVPYFKTLQDGPSNQRGIVGKSLTFNCNAAAVPAVTSVSWFRNGSEITNSLPSKYSLSSDRKSLTINNLCKGCGDEGDLGVIQCIATNTNGYVLGQGYVNVFEPIIIKNGPKNTVLNYPNPIEFTCEATHDPDTPVTYTWTYEGQPMLDGRLNTSQSGSLVIDIRDLEDKGNKYLGKWDCTVSNGFDSAVASASLTLPGAATGTASVVKWIPLIVILPVALLLLLLLLLLCCCLYKNRGNQYPVDEKERKGGHDPEKELKDSGFHDYQRPADHADGRIPETLSAPPAPSQGSQGSINSSFVRNSDDEMSLNDYSNINPGKFTEDGSFIGQYNPGSRRGRTNNHRPVPMDSAA